MDCRAGGRVTDLEFRVLGPVQVLRGGHQLALGGRTTLTLLASLAVSPGRIVPVDRLIDHVWDTDLPAHPRAALHNGVSRLRRLLGGDILQMLGWGYRLDVDAGRLDLLRFDEHLAATRTALAQGRDEDALAALDDALGLWRGALLANVASPALHREVVPRLTDRYLTAVELRAELSLQRGRHETLADELWAVVSAHPLRERLVAQLMVALVRAGRRAEALAAYHALRCELREELGIDPVTALQDLHVAILRGDSSLERAGQATAEMNCRRMRPAAGSATAAAASNALRRAPRHAPVAAASASARSPGSAARR
jgi:DNA-binding SARP family transcriptional activator